MLIIKNKKDKKVCTSPYRNYELILTKEQIDALLDGKTLGNDDWDEYGTFIRMEKPIKTSYKSQRSKK